MDSDLILKVLKLSSWPGSIAIVVYLLAPYVPVLLSKIRTKNGENTEGSTFANQLADLQTFKKAAEENHYTDLESLLKWRDEITPTINKMREDIAYIKGKIGNGYSHERRDDR